MNVTIKNKRKFFSSINFYNFIFLSILFISLCIIIHKPQKAVLNTSDNSKYSSSISLDTNFPSLNISKELINQVNLYNEAKKLDLSTDDLEYYSTLSYDERLDFLFNKNYNLSDRIKVFLSSDINNIGLIYYNLSSYKKISINNNMIFTATSTYKVGLNLLFYHLASIGEINLNDYISYDSSDYEEGTGILSSKSSIESYTIQELLDLSITYSDNIATNMLARHLGGHAAIREKLYNLLEIDFSKDNNCITPEIELSILNYIYKNISNINFSHLIDVLTKTEFHNRLDKYIPQEIVAHKVGSYDSYIHDVGIVLTDNPYILIIYTYDIDNAEEKIPQISKAIYEDSN